MHVLGSCRIRKFPGQTEPTLSAEVELISTIAEKKSWTRPPIQMEFQVSYWLSFIFSVLSCSNFTLKWLRMGSVTLGSLCTRSQGVLLFFLCTSVFNFCCYRDKWRLVSICRFPCLLHLDCVFVFLRYV